MSVPVLVVGGAGYIGAHTCKALAAVGFTPVTFDNLELGHASFVRWGPLIEGDIRDRRAVEAALRSSQAKAVIHFAALALVGESVTNPAAYYDNNVGGTLSLLNAMRDSGVDQLVFSSTCAVYGQPERDLIDEGTPTSPINPYGRSKLVCEGMITDFQRAHCLRAVRLRYFNASGADAEGEVGELRDPETHLIPRALMALQGHISDFEVFGSDFPTPDGTAIRDYIHVTDLAQAHVLALRKLLGGFEGDVYNLGVGHGYSVGEVLAAIRRVTGRNLPAPAGARRPGDPARLVAMTIKARDGLGFAPVVSGLETIVSSAWRWHQQAHPARA